MHKTLEDVHGVIKVEIRNSDKETCEITNNISTENFFIF